MSNLFDILRSEQKKNTKMKINYITLHGYIPRSFLDHLIFILPKLDLYVQLDWYECNLFKAFYTLDILALYSYSYADYTYIKNFSYNIIFISSTLLHCLAFMYKKQPDFI